MKRKLLLLSVLAICVATLAAGTLAYFSADGTARNVITTGNVSIAVEEWADADKTQPFEDLTGIMPGTTVTKIAEVRNTGEADAWIRVRLTGDIRLTGDGTPDPSLVKPDLNTTDWTLAADGYLYCNKAIRPGETTAPCSPASPLTPVWATSIRTPPPQSMWPPRLSRLPTTAPPLWRRWAGQRRVKAVRHMKKMRHMKRKALVALVLSVTMLLTLMPGLVFGVSDDQGDPDTVSSSIDYPTVNFTDVAPFLPPGQRCRPRRSPARTAGDANTGSDNGDNGMVVNKTAVYNEETGAYDITLEAYATGSKIISTVTSDVPTDVILVLDQSGSMDDDMGQLVYTAYSGNTRQNSNLYEKQDNLWYKLSDGSYVAVTVTSRNDSIQYTPITNGRNNEDYDWWSDSTYTNLWDNKDNLYAKVNDEYQKVTVSRSGYGNNRTYTYTLPDGTQIASSRGDDAAPTISNTGDGYLYLASIDTAQTVYTYTYTDANGTVQTIGTSTGDSTNFTAATLYSRSTTDSGISRLTALKNAAATFANAVEEKAKGADGALGTEDDISHRIAVVGFASQSDYGDNTELLSIAGSNSGSVGVAYNNITDQNLKDVLQKVDTSAGQTMVSNAIGALAASGATQTDLGLDMAQRILSANPVQPNESATVWSSSLRTVPPPASTALRRMSPTTPSPMPAPSRPPEPPSTPSASSPEPTLLVPAPSPKVTLVRTAAP